MNIEFLRRYSITQVHDTIDKIECSGPSLCWAIGLGHLLRSDMIGRSWSNLYFRSPLKVGTNPHRISFHSDDDGILLAKEGPMTLLYFHTKDSGRTWSKIRELNEGGYVWAELFALPKKEKLWSLIKQRGRSAFIETTCTSSKHWERFPTSIVGEPCGIQFADEFTGWMLERWQKDSWLEGSPAVESTTSVLHHTRDGGVTWEIIFQEAYSCGKLLWLDGTKLVMAGEDGIFLSPDGGLSWDHVLRHPRVPLLDIHFRGPIGISVGTEGLIESKADILLLLSQDGGRTWKELETPGAEAFVGVRMMGWSSGVLASCNSLYTFDLG